MFSYESRSKTVAEFKASEEKPKLLNEMHKVALRSDRISNLLFLFPQNKMNDPQFFLYEIICDYYWMELENNKKRLVKLF